MPGVTAGREEGVAVPSPLTAAEEGAALPADDVLARLGSGTLGVPGDEAARRLRVVGPNAVRPHRVHALSVLASQLRTPLLMLLADGIARCERSNCSAGVRNGWLSISAGALAVVGLAASATLLALLWQSRHLPFEPDIGNVLATHNMDTDTLSTSHMLDLSYASFAALRLPAILAAVVLMVAPLLSFVLRIRRRHYVATWVLAAGMAVFLVAAHIALGRFGPYLSSKELAREIAARARPEDRVMIYGDQAFGSSLLFYLQRPVELVEGRTTSMWFGSTFPDAPKIYLSDADLQKEWSRQERVFLFVPSHLKHKADALLPSRFVVAEVSGKYVYSNRP